MEDIKRSYSFEKGHNFYTNDGQSYTVTGYLGRGGQGEAYRVLGREGEFAIKWYHRGFLSRINADEFYRLLSVNVENGVPRLSNGYEAEQFIWPLKMVRPEADSFGYLMKIFPAGYEPFSNIIMMRKRDSDSGQITPLRWKSWFTEITAALNITDAFEILHKKGLSYQDLNAGAISINMENGNVLICDCDNVSPDGSNYGIKGTLDYMAPEVLCGKAKPDRHTDEYSLAVILFRLFLHGHPMHGIESTRIHNSEQISQQDAELMIYGSQPHYVLAPGNNPNPPDPQRNRDVYILRNQLPPVLLKAFQQVFTEGVTDSRKRLTATEWRKVLLKMRDNLVLVDGREQFYNPARTEDFPADCRMLVYPNDRKVLCTPGKILYKYHLSEHGTDFTTPVGKIIPTKIPNIIGLYNATGYPIRYGENHICPDQGKMPLTAGMVLEINNLQIKVQ